MNILIDRVGKIKYLEYIILSFILILGFSLRLYKINSPVADWHSWRQADTASVTKTFVSEGINLLMPRYHDISSVQSGTFNPNGWRFVEFPIFNAVHAILFKAFQAFSLEVWGRLVSIFSSLVSAYFLFLLGKRFIGGWGGVLAALFYVSLPFNIFFTRVILPEPMAVSFALASVWVFVKFIDSEKFKFLYISGIIFAIGMLVKPFIFFYSIPLVYLAVKKYGLKNMIKTPNLLIKFLIAVNIALVPFFTWRVWVNQYPEGIPFWKWAFNGDKIRFKPSFWRWIFGERLGHMILGGWGLIPFSFGLLKPKKEYFNHSFILGMFLYAIVFATANVKHDYYQTFFIPAVALILSQGTLYMWETKIFNKWLTRGTLAFSFIVMFLTSGLQVREFYKINRPEIIEAGKAIQRITPKDALVIAPYNGDTAFLYQTERRGWPVVDLPIDELIEKGADYFVSVDLSHPQTVEFSQRFLVVEKTNSYVILNLGEPKEI